MDTRVAHTDFGHTHFGAAALGDKRRTERLVYTANKVMESPTVTWPARLSDPADLDAFYSLVNQEAVTHASILKSHVDLTLVKMNEEADPVLVLHDTTELDYSGLKSIDLGQIGNGHGRGYLCHNSLAVTPRGEVLGLVNQILFRRPKRPKKEKKKQIAQRPDRESRLWKRGSAAIPAAPAGGLWVDIADRGADLTEFLAYEIGAGKHFVVRSKCNRKVVVQAAGTAENPGSKPTYAKLHDVVRQLPEQDRRPLSLPSGNGRMARETEIAVAFVKLQIVPPRQARGEHGRELLEVWAVRVWEPNPPAGVEPVEWILLTNVPVTDLTKAWERVDWYKRRWILEEYHKTKKSGCLIEQMQFTTEGALQPAIALLSVVALGLMWLRQVSRSPEAHKRRASEWFPRSMIRVLAAWDNGQARDDLTAYDFCYILARLGGHQNRKSDHPPGLLVLWRGWTKLQLMTEGASYNLAE